MSRKLVIGLLLMLSVVVTSFTYAYWSVVDYTVQQDANTVLIGEAKTASVGVTVSQTNGQLVPPLQSGNSVSAVPVEYVIFTFVVTLADNTTGIQSGTLAATVNTIAISASGALHTDAVVTAVQIGGTAPVAGVLGTSNTAITEGIAINVYVKVTLDGTYISTEAIYLDIINENITFDVDFIVTIT